MDLPGETQIETSAQYVSYAPPHFPGSPPSPFLPDLLGMPRNHTLLLPRIASPGTYNGQKLLSQCRGADGDAIVRFSGEWSSPTDA